VQASSSPIPILGVGSAPERDLEHNRFAPRFVHPLHFLGSVAFLGEEGADRGIHRGGEGEKIPQRNVRWRFGFVRQVLLGSGVPQADLFLVVEPRLIVRSAAGVQPSPHHRYARRPGPQPEGRRRQLATDTAATANLVPTRTANTGVSRLPIPKPLTEAMDPVTNPNRQQQARPFPRTSFRRELAEVVDAELFLDGGDLIDRLLEALLPEQPVLLLLELLAKFLQLLRRDNLVEGRK
jgi:hypothetical protein